MERAWIAGKPVALDAAIAEAARLIAASRQTLIAGLGADLAGARAAIALAARTGAVLDHMHSDAVLRDLDVMRSSGVMLTTAPEARARADVFLLCGPGLDADLLRTLLRRHGGQPPERRAFWLCPNADAAKAVGEIAIAPIGKRPRELPVMLAALRARIAGRSIGKLSVPAQRLDAISSALKAARFGVALWSAAALDALSIEMLCGLVADLNASTRFSGLPVAPEDNAIGVLHACGWMTGFPMRTGFGRRTPQHDPWLFDGRRLVGSGEVDCALWISAYRAEPPPWRAAPPTIALMGHGARFDGSPHVHIAVGCPGVDHAGVQHASSTGTLAAVAATRASDTISVADAITRIGAAVPNKEARRC